MRFRVLTSVCNASDQNDIVSVMEHSSYTLLKGAIESLCYTILLRPVAHGVTSGNPMLNAELLKLLRHVLPSLIVLQSSYFDVQLSLCIGFELFESTKCITLLFER